MDNEKPNTLNKLLKLIIVISVVLIACISCKSVQYVPVPNVGTDVEYKNSLSVDSFVKADSFYLHEYVKGDTVYRDREVTRWRDRKKEVHDTTYITKTDSVYVPYPVEKDLNLWEQTKVSFGGMAILICAVLFLVLLATWKHR